MRVDSLTLGRIMRKVDEAVWRVLKRELPGEDRSTAEVRALVMEIYEQHLGEGEKNGFREQMTKKYGVKYPLDLEVT